MSDLSNAKITGLLATAAALPVVQDQLNQSQAPLLHTNQPQVHASREERRNGVKLVRISGAYLSQGQPVRFRAIVTLTVTTTLNEHTLHHAHTVQFQVDGQHFMVVYNFMQKQWSWAGPQWNDDFHW